MKQLMGVKPNLWHFIQSISNQEAETRRLLISNASGLDLTANQGRRTMLKDKHFRVLSLIQKIDELTPLVYLETMAKFMDYD